MKRLTLILNLALITGYSFSQTINIHSVSALKQTGGENGYTLDGQHMLGSRAKLLNTSSFGSGGTYPKEITITDNYYNTGSLESINDISDIDIFFFGTFIKDDPSYLPVSDAGIDSLYEWSKNGGKLIISNMPNAFSYDFSILNSRWGYDLIQSAPSNFIPTTAGNTSDIFNGPFGMVSTANQGGSVQGYFNTMPAEVIILAENSNSKPTLFLDCNTLDLICADIDGYTDLGGVTTGFNITSEQDRFWANTIAYMDKLEDPPAIDIDENSLITGNYDSYQWYYNGNPINGANSQTIIPDQNGQYTVEISYFNGCTAVSKPFSFVEAESCEPFVPNTFSPNGDLNNDELFVRGNGIEILKFLIYDRWGEKVFETNDINNGWNGTFRGIPLDPAVFVYYVESKCTGREGMVYKQGNVTLVR